MADRSPPFRASSRPLAGVLGCLTAACATLSAPLGGPEQVLKYLARYTHRVATSNQRLLSLEDGRVTFEWKDYATGSQTKTMMLDAVVCTAYGFHSGGDDGEVALRAAAALGSRFP